MGPPAMRAAGVLRLVSRILLTCRGPGLIVYALSERVQPDNHLDWREPMKTLASAIAAASVTLLGTEIAYAGAPSYLVFLNIPIRYWIFIIVILLILNLLCCWLKK
jgi:hypothetical protein